MSREIERKAREALRIYRQIRRLRQQGIRESTSLDKLKEELKNLTNNVLERMVSGDRLKDPVLDYCIKEFDITNNRYENRVKKLELFRKQVAELRGQRILSTGSLELGIISGESFFDVKESFRHLYVPVKELLVFNRGKWKAGMPGKDEKHSASDKMSINPDIFTYPSIINPFSFREGNYEWRTDHSRKTYIGGPEPAETKIYLGNFAVESGLRSLEYEIPARKVRVPAPKF